MDEGKRRRRNYFKFSLRMWKNCALKGELFTIQFNGDSLHADKAPIRANKLRHGVKKVENKLNEMQTKAY